MKGFLFFFLLISHRQCDSTPFWPKPSFAQITTDGVILNTSQRRSVSIPAVKLLAMSSCPCRLLGEFTCVTWWLCVYSSVKLLPNCKKHDLNPFKVISKDLNHTFLWYTSTFFFFADFLFCLFSYLYIIIEDLSLKFTLQQNNLIKVLSMSFELNWIELNWIKFNSI